MAMPGRKDPVRVGAEVVVYVVFFFAALAFAIEPLMRWFAGDLGGLTSARLLGALMANWLALRVFTEYRIADLGLLWNRPSADNLVYGLGGGVGAALLALGAPLLVGAAHWQHTPDAAPSAAAIPYVGLLLLLGSAGEEIFFRGFGFQALMGAFGELAAIIPGALAFGLLHLLNPNSSWLGAINTIGFGVVFGYAFARSRDLWLPIGLHFGWNLTLPLFGAALSGLRINITGYEMSWTAGKLWSGGDYGPEAGLWTSVVVMLMFAAVRKAPIRRQAAPIAGPPIGSEVCESPPLLS
jgi:membrane protease YdiL (CAAX protease family)